MSRQILLYVETNKTARTDYKYIDATIKRFYVNDRKIVYRPIFMESKTNYNSKDVVKEINAEIKKYPGKTDVIYCVDVDEYDISPETKKLYDNIEKYCSANDYQLVFFKRDIEDVYLGHSVSDSDKVKKAEEFTRKKMINGVKEVALTTKQHKNHASNILIVLDLFWKRKV